MKILLLAAGRRVSFVRRLIDYGYEVFSFETDPYCALANLGEAKVYFAQSKDQAYEIAKLCKEHDIKHILPLSDYWAVSARDVIKYNVNVTIIGPDYMAANTCYNKFLLEYACLEDFPSLSDFYPKYKPFRDFIIKDTFGNGSKGIEYVRGLRIDKALLVNNDTKIVQRRIYGKEYSVDAYFDRECQFVGCVPRSRDRIAGGEVVDSLVLPRSSFCFRLIGATKKIGETLNYSGPACFQFIMENYTNKIYLIEINARLGGGCILSLQAGFDMINMFTQEYILHQRLDKAWYHFEPYKIGMKRVFMETFYNA